MPEIFDLQQLSDAALVDAAGGWAGVENAACARKLAVMAEIFHRRTGLAGAEREWWLDPQAAVAAELSAAVNVSQGMALHQTHRGVALRDRLPQVARPFEAGLVSEWLVRTIVWGTHLITDASAMAAVDAALAGRITRCGALSVAKTEAAIDALVEEFDPDALRRARESVSRPTVEFGSPSDVAGTTSMWARLYAADAVLLEARVEEMARSVCAEDPRSIDERRAAALIALGARTELACARTQPDCGAGPRDQPPAKNAVVYVIAEQESVDTATTAAAATEPVAEPVPREVRHPGDTAPEPRYTPSRTIAEFVRCRDLTCRFPGCDKPAQVCDSDHTVPYPVGPTHPSNLKCLCRFQR